jgi:tripeptide aminopeptidase
MTKQDAVNLVLELLAVPGKSGEEAQIRSLIERIALDAGVPVAAISGDQAHKKSHRGGQVGNLIIKLPGTRKGARRLLMSHMDTVPLCVGAQPVIRHGQIVSKNPATALGGDNRAGCAIVLSALLSILQEGVPHPPLTFLWTVQEEVGLLGARHVSLSKLGNPSLCFNWDGGAPNIAVIGATGDDHLDITIYGLASHAGGHPEEGISAIVIASLAIADLQENGWHGLIEKGKQTGTSNVGSITGGAATNVVTDLATLTAECRSHNPKFRARIVDAWRKAFEKAAAGVTNVQGECGRVTFEVRDKYESFRIPKEDPSVQAALAAVEAEGLTPLTRIVNGGLDANWLTSRGLPTVTLGCGQDGIHTVKETLDIDSYWDACRIALRLATGDAAE